MLSLYEILKASKTGIAPDMWTALAGANFGGAGSGAEVKELTGIPPLSFRADGTPLLDYLISGNMSQTGTPTPTTPIQPQETGDLETEGAKAGQYKIPILSASTTTPVYLGEVQTTRKIKKLVLTGEEVWKLWSSGQPDVERYYYKWGKTTPSDYSLICTHLPFNFSDGNFEHIRLGGSNREDFIIFISKTIAPTVADFKSYLAQQYAAGTPVTVWYVLATPTTGIVNEPLRKIGDYADTLSMEQAGVSIPTLHGNTVIDVMTELKPSEMYIKYKG